VPSIGRLPFRPLAAGEVDYEFDPDYRVLQLQAVPSFDFALVIRGQFFASPILAVLAIELGSVADLTLQPYLVQVWKRQPASFVPIDFGPKIEDPEVNGQADLS